MSRTLTVSDELYARLEVAARQRGFHSVEQLLETWQASANELNERKQAVRQIDALRARLVATYGQMPDSAALIREDRGR
jgi:hypothetical protein